jgi:uncharacterized membrane protein
MDSTHSQKDNKNIEHFFCEHHSLDSISNKDNKSNINKNLTPLFVVICGIFLVSLIRQFNGSDFMLWMMDFMGIFLVTFGLFKLYDLKGFAEGFSTYDLIAKRFKVYAFAFPFIEIVLGFMYLLGFMFLWQNVLVLLLSILGCVSAYKIIKKKEEIECVCLGTAFKLPMTWVTFTENFLMLIMVLFMLAM